MQGNFVFILVRPVFLGNIGATARVLKNFGFSELRLVDPPRNYQDSEARRMSVGAFDLLKKAKTFGRLSDALNDISMAIGTTAAQQRDEQPLTLAQAMPKAMAVGNANLVAWVFGDERNGLLRDELKRCHQTVSIETSPEFPSLNVSQAVGIIAYQLHCHAGSKRQLTEDKLPTGAMDDELLEQIESLLSKVEFTRSYNHQVITKEIRALYQRMLPTEREAAVLSGLVRRINQKLDDSV